MDKNSEIRLNQGERKNYKKEIDFYISFYQFKIKPLFSEKTMEKEIEKSEINGREKYLNMNFPEYPDESDYYNSGQEKGYEKYLYYKILKNNIKLSIISTGFQFWVQQLRFFLYNKFRNTGMIDRKTSLSNFFPRGYTEIKSNLEKYVEIPENIWEDIKYINLLNNVIKHGKGKSEDCLRKSKPEWFLKTEEHKNARFYEEPSLDLDIIVVDEILGKLKKFWDDFPSKSSCLKDYDLVGSPQS